jgi:membrane protease YdiL (CAAX protease family)
LNYDEAADVRLILAEAHLARGENQKLVELLTTRFDRYKHDDAWYLLEKMKLLSRAGAMDAATSLYEQLAQAEYYNHLDAARTLRNAQAVDLARLEIQKAAAAYTGTTEDEKQLFFLEFEHGTGQAALKAYNAWRDAGWKQDPIGMNRIALAARDITLPWHARDVLALLLAVLVLMVVAVTCGAPVLVVHYWGFVRRHRNAASYPTDGWQLRHAWAALAAFGSMAIIGMYAAGPLDFDVNALYQLNTDLQPAQWSRYALLEALLTTAAMIVVLKLGPQNENTRSWSTNWTLLKALSVGAAIGLALRIPLMLTALSHPDALPQVSEGDLWQMLRHIRDQMGFITALWLVGLMAPVVEEFIFRRVLLDSFTSHLGFARANFLQAALFAAIHMDASAFIPLFGLGLLLAYLARRSGGLLAPMIVHAVFNLIAGLILLR